MWDAVGRKVAKGSEGRYLDGLARRVEGCGDEAGVDGGDD